MGHTTRVTITGHTTRVMVTGHTTGHTTRVTITGHTTRVTVTGHTTRVTTRVMGHIAIAMGYMTRIIGLVSCGNIVEMPNGHQ